MRLSYLLPLMMLSACSPQAQQTAHTPTQNVSWQGIPLPTDETSQRSVIASSDITLNGETVKLGFHTLARTGDLIGEHRLGTLVDARGKPIKKADGEDSISDLSDFSSLLPVGEQLFMLTHFESVPSSIYLTELEQNASTGAVSALRTRPVNLSAVRGGWAHCAGSVTPWGSHLASEEYPPDARDIDPVNGDGGDYFNAMASYFDGEPGSLRPYDYGFPIELTVNNWQHVEVKKHYAMGRLSYELAKVMPDQRTAYLSDDETNVPLLRFEMTHAGKLDEGELFAAIWHQTSSEGGGKAKLEWISLGVANNAQIRAAIDGGIRFKDIFFVAKPEGTGCPADFTSVHTAGGHECLTIKPGMEIIASRLETRRVAAIKGATTEFRKMEGIAFDAASRTLYVSISEVVKGMQDNVKWDKGGPNHVQLPKNPCGAVFALPLDPHYVAHQMQAALSGREDNRVPGNHCDVDQIANPDNLTFIDATGTLVISEDSAQGHRNDAMWAWQPDSGTLTRILTTPYGSEATSSYFYPDIGGWAYLMSVVQHPFGESDRHLSLGNGDTRSYIGYLGPVSSPLLHR